MIDECWQRFYPAISGAFQDYPEMLLPGHPVGFLLRCAQDRAGYVRARTEQCINLVLLQNKPWLESKIRTMRREEKSLANVKARIGEIRAYGELLWAWPSHTKPETKAAGRDFIVEVGDSELWIEVQTPNIGPPEKCVRVHRETTDGNASWRMTEFAPFRFPKDLDDTFQGRCASKITAIKKREHQFDDDTISILWLDLKDPTIWLCGFPSEQALPLYWEQETLVPGFLWHALYAEKGDPMFDKLSVEGMHPKPRTMEFSGRFNQETRIDFVIVDTWSDKIIFEKHKDKKEIPDIVYKDLFRLFPFNLQLSWLDWPIRGALAQKVERARSEIKAFCSALKLP